MYEYTHTWYAYVYRIGLGNLSGSGDVDNVKRVRLCMRNDMVYMKDLGHRHDEKSSSIHVSYTIRKRSSLLLLVIALLLLQELFGSISSRSTLLTYIAYLDKRLSRVQEVLSTLGLRALLVPINDSLVRDTVLIVQNLHKL